MAELHPRLKQDCLLIGRFPLCHLLLLQDANYPWFILVPDRAGVTEIHQLHQDDRARLWRESHALSIMLAKQFQADKLNIAALGNLVPQLHVHHVVRYRTDPAWPAPVWGAHPPRAYTPEQLAEVLDRFRVGAPDDLELLV